MLSTGLYTKSCVLHKKGEIVMSFKLIVVSGFSGEGDPGHRIVFETFETLASAELAKCWLHGRGGDINARIIPDGEDAFMTPPAEQDPAQFTGG